MSGEALGDVSFRFEEAAEQIQEWARQRKAKPKKKAPQQEPKSYYGFDGPDWEYDWTPSEVYVKENPDAPYLKSAKALKAATLKRLEDVAARMAYAAELAHEANLLLSDDNGPEAFCIAVEKILLKKEEEA